MADTDTRPSTVRRMEGAEAAQLAALATVFEDLQYVLRCCEHLVTALSGRQRDDALVEALWTGALVGYTRCFSGRAAVLTTVDLAELEIDGDVERFHGMFTKLRDHYASRHVNPRESVTVGVAQSNDGRPNGVAIVSAPSPAVDESAVRVLGRVCYGLSGLVDARMQQAQNDVLGAAGQLSPAQLAALPLVHLTDRP
ncbi:hypothetical protein ACQEVB_33865 [Pseudonocardia sp. CA-107938]|uniref:hypothetical protein n=1 Tax=Pseudonocardia sp. CA-107938 TaxID=3240021 RepID=UPI003D920B83